MKNLKKIIVASALSMIMSASAFAASGFEFILNVPVGMSIGMYGGVQMTAEPKTGSNLSVMYDSSSRRDLGFDIGVAAQIGYMWQVVNNFGISLLGEVGYNYDRVKLASLSMSSSDYQEANSASYFSFLGGSQNMSATLTYSAHSFRIGIMPKFNIYAFSIGIGGGVIIPAVMRLTTASYSSTRSSGGTYTVSDTASSSIYDGTTKVNSIGFYAKLTLDYSIFFRDNMAINIGLYGGFDAIGQARTYFIEESDNNLLLNSAYLDYSFLNFDVGLQLGFRFGPKAF